MKFFMTFFNLRFKHCRRLGENYWNNRQLTPKQKNKIKLVVKKNASRKQSDFSKKLQQMKKLAYFYGIRSLNKSFAFVKTVQLDKKKSIILNFESRLDIILVRIYFFSTLFTARQYITHNKIFVNSNVCSNPGFFVRSGDFISIAPTELFAVKNQIRQSLRLSFSQSNNYQLKNKPGGSSWFRRFDASARELEIDGGYLKESASFKDRQGALAQVPKEGSVLSHLASEPIACKPVPGASATSLQPFLRRALYSNLGVSQRSCPSSNLAPQNLEVNYKTMSAVLLYEPTLVNFPYKVDLDLLF